MIARGRFRERSPTRAVAVVVPLSLRPGFSADEETSLRHLRHYLGAFDKYMLAPRGMRVNQPGFEVLRFGSEFFGSADAQTRLWMRADFYERFRDYEYILTYHTDSIVLSDRLLEWCGAGYDFIGAPNVSDGAAPVVMLNGGFALRKVSSFLKVLYSDAYAVDPDAYWRSFAQVKEPLARFVNLPRKYLKRVRYFNNVRRDIALFVQDSHLYEDIWFHHTAQKYYPEFRLPSEDVARRFSFDMTPRLWFEMTNRELPFGAHAWYKRDREFWRPYLLP